MVYNLGEDFTKEEFIAEFGEGSTFPQVCCEGKKLGGSIETIQFLKKNESSLLNINKTNDYY